VRRWIKNRLVNKKAVESRSQEDEGVRLTLV